MDFKLDKKGFFLLSAISLTGNIVGMGIAYLLHFFMVRMLTQADYGNLSTLIGLAALVTVPQLTLQGLISREVALAEKNGNESLALSIARKYAVKYFLLGLGLFFVASLGVLLLFGGINQISLAGITMLLSVPILYAGSSALGYFQGKEEIYIVSLHRFFDPLFRTSSAVLLVWLGFGLIGAASSFVFAHVFVVLLVIYIFLNSKTVKTAHMSLRGSITWMVATNILMMFIIYADLFFVRFFLSAEQAGIYNTASMTAKILFFTTNALVMVLLPKTTKLSLVKDRREILFLLAKAALILAPIAVVFVVFSPLIITFFYTAAYSAATAPFQLLSVGLFFFAIYTFITNIFWSQKEEKLPLVMALLGALALPLLLYFAVSSYGLLGAAASTTLVSILLAILSAACLFVKSFKKN